MNEYFIKTVFLGEQTEMQKLKTALENEPVEGAFTKVPVDSEYSPVWAEHLRVLYSPIDDHDARLDISYVSRGLAASFRDYCTNHGIQFKQNGWYVQDDCAAWQTTYFYSNNETGEEKSFVVIEDDQFFDSEDSENKGDVFDLDDDGNEVNLHFMTDREGEILAFIHNYTIVVDEDPEKTEEG